MAVDWMRSSKTSYMRFWPDRPDKVVKVRWFQTNLPFIPYYNSFGSTNWLNDRGSADQGVGEAIDLPQTWNNGSVPFAYPGIAPCGTPDQWLHGVPYPGVDPPPVTDYSTPSCCLVDFCGVPSWTVTATCFSGACAVQNGTYTLLPYAGHPCQWISGTPGPGNYWVLLSRAIPPSPGLAVLSFIRPGSPIQPKDRFVQGTSHFNLNIGYPNTMYWDSFDQSACPRTDNHVTITRLT